MFKSAAHHRKLYCRLNSSDASCIECCIVHSNRSRAGQCMVVVVVVVVACCCMVMLQPTPTCTDAGPDLLQLALLVLFLQGTGANTPLTLVQLALCDGAI